MNYKIRKLNLVIRFFGKKIVFWFFIGILSSLAMSVVELLIAYFIQLFFVSFGSEVKTYKILNTFTLPTFTPLQLVSFLCIIGILRFFSQYFYIHCSSIIQENLSYRLKLLATSELIDKNPVESGGASDVNIKISEIFPKAAQFSFFLMQFLSLFIISICLFIIMMISSWKETIIGIIGILIIAVVVLKITNKIKKSALIIPKEQSQIIKRVQKISRNWLFITIMDTKEKEKNEIHNNITNYSLNSIKAASLSSFTIALSPFLGILLLIFIIYFSQQFWNTNFLILITFLYIFIRFIQNLTTMLSAFTSLHTFYPQFKEAFECFNKLKNLGYLKELSLSKGINFIGSIKKNTAININESKVESQILQASPPQILIQNLEFKYPLLSKNTINEFNIKIQPGEHIGISGPSGAGKSTLLLLIFGILKPNHGTILIDNIEPSKYFNNTNNRVGYVGAEPYLINGNLYENLCYGIKRVINEEEIWEALEFASIKEYVQSVGLNYQIEEDQSSLSSGQKQRICLARAILNKPQLLILDEASANLDETTELDIANSICKLKKKCTVIVVSHRPGMLTYLDYIIKMPTTT